jgi:hypothetical protein
MPPRHAYWTIIVDDLPTAFRAAQREELLPTFERLRQKHPSAALRWFARGRLWDSPEAARQRPAPREREQRGRDWRPGGTHRDPRERFREERQGRWRAVREQARLRRSEAVGRRESTGPPKPSFAGGPRRPKPHEDQPDVPAAPPPAPPPGPDRPPRPGHEPLPVPSPNEEVVIPREPPERGGRRRPSKSSSKPPRRR